MQILYANMEEGVTDRVPVGIGRDDNEPTLAPALSTVIESLNVVLSFVECSSDDCSGGDCEMLHVIIRLESMGGIDARSLF